MGQHHHDHQQHRHHIHGIAAADGQTEELQRGEVNAVLHGNVEVTEDLGKTQRENNEVNTFNSQRHHADDETQHHADGQCHHQCHTEGQAGLGHNKVDGVAADAHKSAGAQRGETGVTHQQAEAHRSQRVGEGDGHAGLEGIGQNLIGGEETHHQHHDAEQQIVMEGICQNTAGAGRQATLLFRLRAEETILFIQILIHRLTPSSLYACRTDLRA